MATRHHAHKARLGKKLRGRPGTLRELQQIVWNCLKRAQGVMEEVEGDRDFTLRACHAVSQIAGQYGRLLEIGELEARVQVLEARLGEDAQWSVAAAD